MRKSREEAAQTRERIIAAAAEQFRDRGGSLHDWGDDDGEDSRGPGPLRHDPQGVRRSSRSLLREIELEQGPSARRTPRALSPLSFRKQLMLRRATTESAARSPSSSR